MIVLAPEAVDVLSRISRLADNGHVIPGKIKGRRRFGDRYLDDDGGGERPRRDGDRGDRG